MSIRFLKKDDRAVYLEMAEEFYSSPAVEHNVDPSHFERAFDEMTASHERAVGFIIEKDKKPVGYAVTVRFYSQEAGGEVIWIDEIYVRPEARSSGLGRAAFKEIFAAFPEAAAFRLEIEPENERAKKLYLSLGFRDMAYAPMIKTNNRNI